MNYAATQTRAKDMLDTFGQAVTLQAPTNGTYDPATTTISGGAPAAVQTVGAVFPLSQGVRGFKYGTADQPGTTILSSDQQLLLPGDIAQPPIGTKATIGTDDYTIIAVSPLNPGGTCVLYECVIRGPAK